MRKKGRGNSLLEVGSTFLLLATLVIGYLVGLVYTKLTREGGEMTKDQGWWLSALATIVPIAVLRLIDQLGSGYITSDLIPIVGRISFDMGQLPRTGYVLAEMASAVFVIAMLVYQMKKIAQGSSGLGWMAGMIILMLVWSMHYPLVWILAGIGSISFAAGICEYSDIVEEVWVEFEKGIVTGCLIGATVHYGYLVGCLSVVIVWIIQDRGLWIGNLVGALKR